MKTLVIFYSFDGNTKLIAESIAEEINAELAELKQKDEPKSKGFMKYFWGGRQALMRKKPELLPLDKKTEEYDVIFIGTPVWAWTYAPPLNTFFSISSFSGKKIALFCCHGGGKGKIFDKMKEALPDNQFLGEIDFLEPIKNNKEDSIQKAKKWAKDIKNSLQ
ncbi:MAG: flavodoxin [bacterium]